MRNTRMTVMAQTFNVHEAHEPDLPVAPLTKDHQESMKIVRRTVSIPAALAGPKQADIPKAYAIEPPASRFAAASRGIGFAQIVEDIDGSVRKYALFVNYQDRLYPSTALMALSLTSGVSLEDVDFSKPGRVIVPGDDGDISLPVDQHCRIMANWSGDYMPSFSHFPASVILKFRATDLIRERVHAYARRIQELDATAEAAILNEVVLLKLMENEQATPPDTPTPARPMGGGATKPDGRNGPRAIRGRHRRSRHTRLGGPGTGSLGTGRPQRSTPCPTSSESG